MTTSPCPLCTTVADDPLMIFQSERVALTHMPGIDLPGYLVIASRRHVEHRGELDRDEREELARLESRALRVIKEIPGVRKVYTLSFGEVVPHLHTHLFPRTDAMADDPACLSGGVLDGPRIFEHFRSRLAVPDTSEEVLDLAARLRAVFNTPDPFDSVH